jgi:hypothetical protein
MAAGRTDQPVAEAGHTEEDDGKGEHGGRRRTDRRRGSVLQAAIEIDRQGIINVARSSGNPVAALNWRSDTPVTVSGTIKST